MNQLKKILLCNDLLSIRYGGLETA